MPAKSDQVSLTCGNCGSSTPFTFWHKISGDDYPELKEKVMDGSLFSAQCGACDTLITVVQDLRYSDYSRNKKFFAYLCPKDELQKAHEFIQGLPMLRSNGTRVHVVNTVPELQAIIAAYDLGVPPKETFVDQSVDSAKRAEALNRRIDESFGALEKAGAGKKAPPALTPPVKPQPWSLMGFLKRWFGSHEPARQETAQPASSPKVSEQASAWIRAGGMIGPVEVECKTGARFSNEAECRQFVENALAEFDREHPGRRLAEPLAFKYAMVDDQGQLVPQMEVCVNLKYANLKDAQEHMTTATKAFFDRFEILFNRERGQP